MDSKAQDRLKPLESLRLYTLTEIEPILGVTHRTLLTYIKQGRLKGVKAGGKWKVTEEQVRAFINGGTPKEEEA